MEGIRIHKLAMLLCMSVVLLVGCTSSSKDKDILIQNNTNEDSTKVEEIVKNSEQISIAVIYLEGDDLVTALRMKTFSRFSKREIGKQIRKELKNAYPDMTVTVSVDNKAIVETKKLLKVDDKQVIGKEIKKLKSLIKEET